MQSCCDKTVAVTQSVGRVTVQGLGGVGKTSLATKYAHRYRNLYAGVCWCPAETRIGLMTSLTGLAVSLGVAVADEPDTEKAATAALRSLGEQRATWLLVYDNVSSPDKITDLLPSGGARVLITSRFSDWSDLADQVSLDVLPLGEAGTFLCSRAAREDDTGAQSLATALGCLPLALDHAAAYCKRTQMSFAEYEAKASSLLANVPWGLAYHRSVAATFDLAISDAALRCASTEVLMSFLAQCAPERIPMMLVESAIEDQDELRQPLAALSEVSLVKHDPFEEGTPAVTVHRLVQAVGRVRSAANSSAQVALGRLMARLAAIFPKDGYSNPQSWRLCANLTPHLLALGEGGGLDRSTEFTILPDLWGRAGSYFHGRAAYFEASSLFRKALAARERALRPEYPDTAMSLNNLALLLKDQGDLAGARLLYECSLRICEEALGPEHPDIATCLNNLASLRRDQAAALRRHRDTTAHAAAELKR
jgi:hypothetical protein